MDQIQIQKLKDSYNLFLSGHYPYTPEQFFKSMKEQDLSGVDSDRYGEGEFLQSFEAEIAKELGHQAAVFMPSGTMAQQIALRQWCEQASNQLVGFHPTCHLELHEHQSYHYLHHMTVQLLGDPQSVITLQDLKSMRETPAAVLFELPQREIGGQLPLWRDLCEQVEFLRDSGIRIHLDGARLWECQPFYDRPREVSGLFDSVYVSFYKGLGGLSGSMLLGEEEWISQSRIWLRRHGGNLVAQYPAYISAASQWRQRKDLFNSYWQRAREIAAHFKDDRLIINPTLPQTNMFHVNLKGERQTLLDNGLRAAERTGIWSFGSLVDSPYSGFHKFEWWVGDATMDLSMAQIDQVFAIIFGDD